VRRKSPDWQRPHHISKHRYVQDLPLKNLHGRVLDCRLLAACRPRWAVLCSLCWGDCCAVGAAHAMMEAVLLSSWCSTAQRWNDEFSAWLYWEAHGL